MAKINFHFCAISKISLEHEEGAPKAYLKQCDLRLEVGGKLDKNAYLDGKGLPRKDALKPTTQALLHGIMTNIRLGHNKGWWKDHEHMQYVIDELQRAFVAQTSEPFEATMDY